MPTPPPSTDRVQYVRYDCAGLWRTLGLVSRETELAHRRLADYHFDTGLWVQADAALAGGVTRASARGWPRTLAQLETLGWRIADGALVHDQVGRVRARAVAALRQVREAGHKGGVRRWSGADAMPATSTTGGPLPPDSGTTSDPVAPPSPPNSGPIAPPYPRPSDPIAPPCPRPSDPIAPPHIKINDKDEDREKTSLAFNDAERLMRSASPPSSKGVAEQKFLAQVVEIIAAWSPKEASKELTNWGGWWRNRYRENPDKAHKILAEVRVLIREQRITGTPGAAAGDLWKRLP